MILNTSNFGRLAVDEAGTIEFPQGIPGFEDRRRFLPLQLPVRPGIIFLQSLDQADLCFLAVAVKRVRPDYELELGPDELELLELPPSSRPRLGTDVIALGILSLEEGQEPSVNLLAPLVIHMRTRRAVQAIRPDGRYQAREALAAAEHLCW